MTPWEQNCLEKAEYFTAIRGRNPALRIRKVFKTLTEAVEYAKSSFGSDNRTMIYAVTETGSSAHIRNA